MGVYSLCSCLLIPTLALFSFVQPLENFCKPKRFGEDSIVCECDANYCDDYKPKLPEDGEYTMVTTNMDGLRFYEERGNIEPHFDFVDVSCNDVIYNKTVLLKLNRTDTYQKITGYGGAFTDANVYNIASLSNAMQEKLMKALYTPQGLNYSIARTPIGYTDFSLKQYFYTETPFDVNMSDWKLTEYDYKYKIPYINWAKKLNKDDFHILSCLWTVPQWMRQNNDAGILTSVNEKYFDAYAKYITKYLEAYKQQGIDIWAVGYANEPFLNIAAGLWDQDTAVLWTTWSVKKLERFAVNIMRPALNEAGFNKTKILFLDDSLSNIVYFFIKKLPKHKKLIKTIDLLGIHSYAPYVSHSLIDMFHKNAPNIEVVNSEITGGQLEGVRLGKWQRAEHYAYNYLKDLNHYVSAWFDWNMVLDQESNPRYPKAAECDASIIANAAEDKFYKQPSYYAIGHFSKFIPRGSLRLQLSEVFPSVVQYGAVLRPDGLVVVILFNQSDDIVVARIQEEKGDVHVILTPNSINTVVIT